MAVIANEMEKLLTPGEEITYVVVQVRGMPMKRDAVVVTSNRIVLYRPGMLGRINFEDYSWQEFKTST